MEGVGGGEGEKDEPLDPEEVISSTVATPGGPNRRPSLTSPLCFQVEIPPPLPFGPVPDNGRRQTWCIASPFLMPPRLFPAAGHADSSLRPLEKSNKLLLQQEVGLNCEPLHPQTCWVAESVSFLWHVFRVPKLDSGERERALGEGGRKRGERGKGREREEFEGEKGGRQEGREQGRQGRREGGKREGENETGRQIQRDRNRGRKRDRHRKTDTKIETEDGQLYNQTTRQTDRQTD